MSWFSSKEIIRFMEELNERGYRFTTGIYDGELIQEAPYYPTDYEIQSPRHARIYGRTPTEDRFNVEFINFLQREMGRAYLIMQVSAPGSYETEINHIWENVRNDSSSV